MFGLEDRGFVEGRVIFVRVFHGLSMRRVVGDRFMNEASIKMMFMII
jgi:hypothetical protein